MKAPSLTLGIEEEYQIIDPQTRELKSYITEILEEGRLILLEQIKAEMHQSIVEVGTQVFQTPAEIRGELARLRRALIELAGSKGLAIAAAGTHPFSSWHTQEITPFDRYIGVKEDMGELAQPGSSPIAARSSATSRAPVSRVSSIPGRITPG